jgi:hypothetical protein
LAPFDVRRGASFGSDERNNGHAAEIANRSKVTCICHRVADFAVTHNATSDVVR